MNNILRKKFVKILDQLHLYSPITKLRNKLHGRDNIHYEESSIKFYKSFLNSGDLCFDVGANVGNRTKTFLKLGCKVVCFEPQKYCLAELKEQFGENKDVVIIPKGLSYHEGHSKFMICENSPTISTMSKTWIKESRFAQDYQWSKVIKIPITTLDKSISEYGLPQFCKIDVEGYEYNVLRGLTQPIPMLSFEFTKELFNETLKCINYLITLGRCEFNCSFGEDMKFVSKTWMTKKNLIKLLQQTTDNSVWGDIYVRFSTK